GPHVCLPDCRIECCDADAHCRVRVREPEHAPEAPRLSHGKSDGPGDRQILRERSRSNKCHGCKGARTGGHSRRSASTTEAAKCRGWRSPRKARCGHSSEG